MLCSTKNTKIGTLNKKRKKNRKSFANRIFFHCFNVFSKICIKGSHLWNACIHLIRKQFLYQFHLHMESASFFIKFSIKIIVSFSFWSKTGDISYFLFVFLITILFFINIYIYPQIHVRNLCRADYNSPFPSLAKISRKMF